MSATGSAAQSLAYAALWWATLSLLAVLGWLVVHDALARWHDRGLALARTLALLACAFAVFVAAHLAPLFRADALRVGLVVAAVVILHVRRRTLWRIDHATVRRMLACEARFAVPFAFYIAMRGLSHDVVGLEKFMDYAFAASALRVEALPVPDPWFAGEPINYYYFGHFVTAFVCKLSGTPLAYGYNLMLATVFGAVFQLAYAIVVELAASVRTVVRTSMGWVAAVWLTLGGNVHGFIYGFAKPWLVDAKLVARPKQAFLLSDPTRFVGWDPPTDDKLIHEFPAYAFYVGDLHAHLLNLPAVLAFCAVLLAWLRAGYPRDGPGSVLARGWLVAAGWLVGVFAMANSWDALMYATVLAVVVLARLAAAPARNEARLAILGDALRGALACAVASLPFLVHFAPHAQGFHATHSHTPAWQWSILYGLQALLAFGGCTLACRGSSDVQPAERMLLVALTAFGLAFALVPEFVYLKDIYGGAFYRGNTAFKFGFQAFTLLTLAACASVALALGFERTRPSRVAIAVMLEIALVPPLYYAWFVLLGGFGVWREREWTLDGQRYLVRNYPEDRAAARFIAQRSPARAALIEAVGDSYTYAARIATNSGVPAVLGWPVHEQLWRGSDPTIWRRRDDVNALYAAKTMEQAQAILDRYQPRWLVIGRLERERYGKSLDVPLLASLGTIAFRDGDTLVVDLSARAASMPLARTP